MVAAAKVQRLHQLLKLDIIPNDDAQRTCSSCSATPDEQDLELLQDISSDGTESLLESNDNLKHKVIFIAGYVTRKYDNHPTSDDENDKQEPRVSSAFIKQLNRGGLSIPKLSTVFFIHSAVHFISKLSPPKSGCRQYIASLLSSVDAPLSSNMMACRTVANILLKARVLHHSDKEQELGCLRRRKSYSKIAVAGTV